MTPLAQQIVEGNRRAIARQITRIENNHADARTVLAELYPHTGQAYLVGITGPPGSGKSTLVNQIAKAYRRQDKTVAILAVDPTSPFTGGAILGDRIRLQDLAGDSGIFVRSMATRGNLGGLARATADAIKVFDAAGFDIILIETVGVGQDEVAIASLAHTVLVVDVPGLGDDIQAIKAGVLEIADIFVINKADREGVDRTVAALKMMLDLNQSQNQSKPTLHHGQLMEVVLPANDDRPPAGWRPPIYQTVATTGEGIEAVVEAVAEHHTHQLATNALKKRERHRLIFEIEELLKAQLLNRLVDGVSPEKFNQIVEQVATRQLDPYTAVTQLLEIAAVPQKNDATE